MLSIELPGRSFRAAEPGCDSIVQAAKDIVNQLDKVDVEEIALFGHSMGAYLSCEIYYEMRHKGDCRLKHLLLSGAGVTQNPLIYEGMSDETLLSTLQSFGGVDPIMFEYPELLSTYFPVIKTDLQMLQKYSLPDREAPIEIPITIIYGLQDPTISFSALRSWCRKADSGVRLVAMEGDHFYMNQQWEKLGAEIKNILM